MATYTCFELCCGTTVIKRQFLRCDNGCIVAKCARHSVPLVTKIKAIKAKENYEASVKPVMVEGDMTVEAVVGFGHLGASLYMLM